MKLNGIWINLRIWQRKAVGCSAIAIFLPFLEWATFLFPLPFPAKKFPAPDQQSGSFCPSVNIGRVQPRILNSPCKTIVGSIGRKNLSLFVGEEKLRISSLRQYPLNGSKNNIIHWNRSSACLSIKVKNLTSQVHVLLSRPHYLRKTHSGIQGNQTYVVPKWATFFDGNKKRLCFIGTQKAITGVVHFGQLDSSHWFCPCVQIPFFHFVVYTPHVSHDQANTGWSQSFFYKLYFKVFKLHRRYGIKRPVAQRLLEIGRVELRNQ